jgi:hypothetical protein
MKHPPRKIPVAATSWLTAVVIASAGWGASALGATTNKADCDAYSSPAEILESPLAALSINPVDHVTIDAENSAIDELETDQADRESAAPFLYLTPRVASVLRDIFDFARDDQSLDSEAEEDAVSSPLAEVEDDANGKINRYEALPQPAIEEEHDLPLLQRQMFRTDI